MHHVVMSNQHHVRRGPYDAAAAAFFGVAFLAAAFLGAAFVAAFFGAAVFLVVGAPFLVFATRPVLVFVRTVGVSTTAGACGDGC